MSSPEGEAEALASAHQRLRRAAILTAVAVAVLSVVTPWSFWEVIGLPVFLLLLPGLAVAQVPLLRFAKIHRIQVYAGSAIAILVLGTAAAGLLFVEGIAPFVLNGLPANRMLVWIGALSLTGLAILGSLSFLELRLAPERASFLLALLPRTPRERAAFVGLSLSAGVGEEVAYRGFALATLLVLGIHPAAAVALSSVAFGFLHAYQGTLGIVRAALVGAVFTLPVLFAGSLYPAVIAHALLDLIGGFVLGPRLARGHAAHTDSTRPAPPLVPPTAGE